MEFAWSGAGLIPRLRRILGLRRLDWIEQDCLRRSDCITVLSEFTRKALQEIHGSESDSRTVTLPGWVDLDRFTALENCDEVRMGMGWRTDVPVFFTLRRLVPRMGLDRLLRAVRRLFDQGYKFQLVIGGAGPLLGRLQELTRDLSLQNSVHFAGRVSDEVLPLMYGACDAFILPSTNLECFGLIVVEALACGRPVLATPVGAIPEVLNGFEARWIARSADEESIAEIMADFMDGRLPTHSAEELRGILKRDYNRSVVLNRMANLILN